MAEDDIPSYEYLGKTYRLCGSRVTYAKTIDNVFAERVSETPREVLLLKEVAGPEGMVTLHDCMVPEVETFIQAKYIIAIGPAWNYE